MKTIIIDTNALMSVLEYKIDLCDELRKICDFTYSTAVLSGTIQELQKIQAEQRGKYRRAAKLALELLKKKQVEVIPHETYVDTELIKLSQQGKIILTQDLALKKKLQRPYLTIRQKKRLVIVM